MWPNQRQGIKMPELEGAAGETEQQEQGGNGLAQVCDGHDQTPVQAIRQQAEVGAGQYARQDACQRDEGKGRYFTGGREYPDAYRQAGQIAAEQRNRLRGGNQVESAPAIPVSGQHASIYEIRAAGLRWFHSRASGAASRHSSQRTWAPA